MFRRKIAKREKKDGEKISHHGIKPGKFPNGFTITSIDPGIKNFAIRIERRTYNPFNVETLLYEKIDFEKERLSESLGVLTCFLNEKMSKFELCEVFIVERQDVLNYKSTRIMQHTLSFFSFNFPDRVIQEFDSHFKSRKLGAPAGLSKAAVKAWTINIVQIILNERCDMESLEKLGSETKQDDLADVVAQIEAFCVINKLKLTMDYTKDWELLSELSYDIIEEQPERKPAESIFWNEGDLH